MNGASPWWKRSWVGTFVLYAVTVLAYRLIDGKEPGSEQVIAAAAMLLAGLGYNVKRPTGPVPKPLLRADEP